MPQLSQRSLEPLRLPAGLNCHFCTNPRYYFGGTGSIPSRALHAITSLVVARGDKGCWESSTVLASCLITSYQYLSPSIYFPQLTFSAPAKLAAGQLFHIVFTNIDANPDFNCLSVDSLYQTNPPSPCQPIASDTDLATLMTQTGQPWAERKGITPIVQLIYTDGWTQGVGYMEVWYKIPPKQLQGPQRFARFSRLSADPKP